MDKKEILNKLQYVLSGLGLDENRKRLLNEVITNLYDFADQGQNPDMTKYLTKDNIPAATSEKIGGIKSQETGTTPGKDYKVEVASDGTAKVNVPWKDTTYSAFKGASSGAAGGTGLVPAPAQNEQIKYLRADGTWQTPPNTTYSKATASADGLMSKEDKAKVDGLILVPTGGAAGQVLKKTSDGVAWQADSNTTYSAATSSKLGLVKQGATVAALEEADEIATVIARVNTLIANLKTAGIIANA